jgi:lipopolysaccharide transport system ATP-binding protein
MQPIIEVDHVTKEFRLGQLTSLTRSFRNRINRTLGRPVDERAPFKALDDVSFTVAPGEVLGIIGHNGAGKSTMLKILAGISQPTRGKVTVRGRVAPLIEVGAGLVADMTGRENIFLNAAILGMRRAEIKRKFDEIVAFSELEEFIDTPVKRYSSGMQVKLGFSIATSVESQILIVDEVLAVGDLAFQRKCFDRMENLIKREGRTVLLVSHNIRQVERICQRAILLNHGKLVVNGEPKAVCGQFYDESDAKINQQSKSARFDSTGDLVLTRVTLLNAADQPSMVVSTGTQMAVEFSFEVKKVLEYPVFGFGIHTTDLLYLATEITEERYKSLRIEPGTLRIRVTIPQVPFLPGSYAIRLGVNSGEITRNIFYAENVIAFLVKNNEIGRSQAASEGFVSIKVNWKLDCESVGCIAADAAVG